MDTTRTLLAPLLTLTLLATACGGSDPTTVTDTVPPEGTTASDQISLDETPQTDDAPGTTEAPADDAADETTTTTAADDVEDDGATDEPEPEATCDSPPAAGDLYWVDVSLDDPDGGLNMRSGASIENDIVAVFERRRELSATGECAEGGDWWEVTNEGDGVTGWVASRYLSDIPVFHGGIGNVIVDNDNVGLEAEGLDALVRAIAESYGADEDTVITVIGEVEAADAVGGFGSWEALGLKDDAVGGFQITVDFQFIKDEDNNGEIVGVTATRITNAAICSRGVTDDGLCI